MSQTDAFAGEQGQLATRLLRSARAGVLSTLSVQYGGWPFGSVVPYALAHDGKIVLVLSDLAEHTRNLRADPRASLFVQDPEAAGNPQAGARVCVMGRVNALQDQAREDARECYLARFPEGAGYLDKLDFRVYALVPEYLRLVGGFGNIAWLQPPG